MADDAIRTMIQEHIRKGEAIPRPCRSRGRVPRHIVNRRYRMIHLSALDAAKAELYSAFRASGLKKVELAHRLGIRQTAVER